MQTKNRHNSGQTNRHFPPDKNGSKKKKKKTHPGAEPNHGLSQHQASILNTQTPSYPKAPGTCPPPPPPPPRKSQAVHKNAFHPELRFRSKPSSPCHTMVGSAVICPPQARLGVASPCAKNKWNHTYTRERQKRQTQSKRGSTHTHIQTASTKT